MIKFVAIGPPKCGTTLLQNVLVQNPYIYLSPKKEIQFFNHHYQNGYRWYNNHFKDATPRQTAGEISPTYCDSFETLKKIKDYSDENNTELKIIFIVRDPLKRLLSEYYHNKRRGNYTLTIEEAIKIEVEKKPADKYYKIVRNSLYNQILNDVFSLFKKENVLVLNSETDIFPPESFSHTIKYLEEFLGVPAFKNYVYNVEDNSSYIPKSYVVQKLLFQKNIIKKISKSLLPSFAVREKIRRFLISTNTKAKGYANEDIVSPYVAQNIYEKYLEDDYILFKARHDYNILK
jgi:hypothetical protein